MANAQARSSSADKPEPDLFMFVRELRVPVDTVIGQAVNLRQLFEQSHADYAGQYTPDLNKILHAGEQLLAQVSRLFDHRQPVAEGRTDWSFFTSTIRHDLRTPVNAIIGYSEMLLEDVQDLEDATLVDGLRQIHSAGQRSLSLINELIFLSQKDAAKPLVEKLETRPAPSLPAPLPAGLSAAELEQGYLLIVDDKESNRDLLSRQLVRYGFEVDQAENGLQALDKLRRNDYDLILLDIIMPEMDGYEVLAHMRADQELQHTPVIMISALDEIDAVVRCIETGAWDYLQKPFNPVILKAKISSHLERKRLRDREQAYLQQLQQEQEKSERLLLNILPKAIADRLKQGERTIADSFSEATILFADLVQFTAMSKGISAAEIVERLSEIFLAFDILVELYNLEKIKTIGDAYMLVGGLPTPRPDHAEAVAEIAIDMFDAIERINKQNASDISIRVGIHTGPVVAGVIGKHKFNYDLWGEAVNVASRMESHSLPGKIQVSETTYRLLQGGKFNLEKRGTVEVKGIGGMVTYWLHGRTSP